MLRSLDLGSARAGPGRIPRTGRESIKEISMLRIYPILIQLVRDLRPALATLARRDADLARQCRRALTSAPLNVAEGTYSSGKNRPARYYTALGSLREALACFEVAEALGYMPELEPGILDRFDRIIATLVRLTKS